jgi:hypothetical protein
MTKTVIEFIKSKFEREFNTLETLAVLTHNQPIYFSWGVSNRVNFNNKALVLKSNARRHKGYIVITLAWNDTYSVYLVSTHGTLKKEFKEVYFDTLVETIDNEIEKVPEYSF